MIGQNIKLGRSRKPSLRYTRGLLGPAIVELGIAKEVMDTNAPINEREGNHSQAALERTNAKSYKAAIGLLKKA